MICTSRSSNSEGLDVKESTEREPSDLGSSPRKRVRHRSSHRAAAFRALRRRLGRLVRHHHLRPYRPRGFHSFRNHLVGRRDMGYHRDHGHHGRRPSAVAPLLRRAVASPPCRIMVASRSSPPRRGSHRGAIENFGHAPAFRVPCSVFRVPCSVFRFPWP